MKLKHISCTQFAGIRDCEVSLKDGINVIYGKNESGKSTLVHLISRTLFQNARLDGRRDKEFADLYFPALKRGSSVVGDFVDGRLTMETAQGTYKLTKEWGADARCVLSTPDGVIKDQSAIDGALKEILCYGEGVYADLLLSSQRSTDAALKTILDSSQKTDAKRELADVVSQAFAESDGISVDAMEQAILEKIEELAGKHWDFEREAPIRKAGGGRYQKQVGEVLAAYYALEDAKAVLEERSRLEEEADRTAAAYMTVDVTAQAAQEECEAFRAFAGRLAMQKAREKELDGLRAEQAKYEMVLQAWPETERLLVKAVQLKFEQDACALKAKVEKAQGLADDLSQFSAKLEGQRCPTPAELSEIRAAQRRIALLENKLCGMNLLASLKTYGEHTVELRSVRTGKLLPQNGGAISLTEAVTVTVPGVLELQLTPADVNIEDLEQKIKKEQETVRRVFEIYAVQSLEQLEELEQTLSCLYTERNSVQMRLDMVLDGMSFEELRNAARKFVPSKVRPAAEIEDEIRALCGTAELDRFITAKETILESYESEYGSPEELTARLTEAVSAKERLEEAEAAETDIPEAFRHISDPEEHLQWLLDKSRRWQRERETALTAKTAAAGKLEAYREIDRADPVYEAERAENALVEKKTLLAHWMHIAEVFAKQKEAVQNDPMQDIAEHFARYLSLLSDGGVTSEFPEKDKLNMRIYSRDRLLDHSKLSEGTKETVSLAFRLSVLEHLFPNGGGLIVLDDPFTDMDTERTKQACALLKVCAKRHQVIFLTCREEYLPMLEGNTIHL